MKTFIVVAVMFAARIAYGQASCVESPTGQMNCEVVAARDQNALATPAANYFKLTANNAVGIAVPTPAAGEAILGDTTSTSSTSTWGWLFNGTWFQRPTANSTTAWQVQNATGTPIISVDTTNNRIGVGTTAPSAAFHAINANNHPFRIGSDTSNYMDVLVGGAVFEMESVGSTDFKLKKGAHTITLNATNGITLNSSGTALTRLISNGSGTAFRAGVDDTTYLDFVSGGVYAQWLLTGDRPMLFTLNTSVDVLTLLPTGRVGVGTTAPLSLFDVRGSSNTVQSMVRAAPTQTMDLQQWANAAATPTPLAGVTSAGVIYSNGGFSASGSAGVTVSGTVCTITAITKGLITAATCE